jgi:hypothetical protein
LTQPEPNRENEIYKSLFFDIIWKNSIKFNANIVGLGLHCLICFVGQISNNCNYQKKFEYLVKFILMKILINLSKMDVCAQSIQNLWLRPLKSGYIRVALTLRRIFSATKSYLIIDSFFLNYDKLQTLSSTIFEGIVEGLIMI